LFRNAIKIVSSANNIRSLYKQGAISTSIGTRETIMAGDMVRDGFTVYQALERCFLPMFEGTNNDGERSTVSKLLMSR
jgi:hypothetical protein